MKSLRKNQKCGMNKLAIQSYKPKLSLSRFKRNSLETSNKRGPSKKYVPIIDEISDALKKIK